MRTIFIKSGFWLWLTHTLIKWPEIQIINSATTTTITEPLHTLFAIHGLAEMIVSDNGSVYIILNPKIMLQE